MPFQVGSRRDHLERAVLDALWQAPGPLTATAVVAALPQRQLAVTTVLTVLERLRGKGLVHRERAGRGYVHRAAHSREDLAAGAMLQVLADGTDGTDGTGGTDSDQRSSALARFAASVSAQDASALRSALAAEGLHTAVAPGSPGVPRRSGDGGGVGSAGPAHHHERTNPMATTTSTTTTVPVTGLTCSGCIETVTEQLSAVAGVSEVTVELVKGGVSTVTVEAERPLDDAQLQEALSAGGAFRIVR